MAADPWAYTPPLSLWRLVEEIVSPKEQDEIKSMLGISLVETSLDLHNEVTMLLEIWQDYKEQTEQESLNARPLAEPPHIRDRLIQEICFLAESVREKSASKGMNPSVLLSRHNSQVLEYAEETKRNNFSLESARPHSARSSDGRQTPLMTSQHANSHFALDSAITEDISAANDRINYLHFDEVCNRLRETLTKEIEQLECDVCFLQSCLTDSLDDPATSALSREPTLTDLKEERSLLEKDLLSAESLPNTPQVHKAPFLPASSSGLKMPGLGPIATKLKPAHTTSTTTATGPNKTGPLKASHHITQTLSASSTSNHHASGHTNASLSAASRSHHTTAPSRTQPEQISAKRGYPEMGQKEGKREGSAQPSRMRSAARVKVVPVTSVYEPRVDSAGSRSLMPTPPPVEDASHVPRPSSAQRFRKMVMSYRESTGT